MEASAKLAEQMASLIHVRNSRRVSKSNNVAQSKWCHTISKQKVQQQEVPIVESSAALATIEWPQLYATWYEEVFHNPYSMTPNAKQKEVLDLVHERRVIEFAAESEEKIPQKQQCDVPLLRLIHGLPGSGKTEV